MVGSYYTLSVCQILHQHLSILQELCQVGVNILTYRGVTDGERDEPKGTLGTQVCLTPKLVIFLSLNADIIFFFKREKVLILALI